MTQIKGFSESHGQRGNGMLVPASNMNDLRDTLALGEHDSSDPFCQSPSDTVLASVFRFHLLRTAATSDEPAVACVAGGIMSAATQLQDMICFHTAKGEWQMASGYESWASSVAKFAGNLLHRRFSLSYKDESVSSAEFPYTHGMFNCVGNCLPWAYCSTVSDDAGLHRSDLRYLREAGLLVKPKEKQWAPVLQFLAAFSPPGFDAKTRSIRGKNGRRSPPRWEPVQTTARNDSRNGCTSFELIPRRTLDLLEQAALVMPRAMYRLTKWDGGWRGRILRDCTSLISERQRYAMWAASVSPDLGTMMRLWDIQAAAAWDSFNRRPIYGTYFRTVDANGSEQHDRLSLSGTKFLSPPWAATGPSIQPDSAYAHKNMDRVLLIHGTN